MANCTYFTADGLQFLRDLRENNDKVWFEANRARFEVGIKAPALELIADLAPIVGGLSPHFVADPRPNGGSLSRIHRDTRFSKDKSPYKTALFAHIEHGRSTQDGSVGFYLHIEPGASIVGSGTWHPAPGPLGRIREAISGDPEGWRKAIAGGKVGKACLMGGEMLKKVPAGFDPEHPFAEDLRRKDFGLMAPLTDEALTGTRLLRDVEAGLRANAAFAAFLCKAIGLPF